jgi:GAF domain-containing protein
MRRQQFLREVSRLLEESVDYRAALTSVARLAVPDIADGCVVDLAEDDGTMARLAVVHKEHDRQSLIDVPPLQPERLRLLRRLGLHAFISTPLMTRGRVLGTITLFTEGVRAFESEDVMMAEELARRAAAAIDHARVYEEAQRALRARDELLAIVSHMCRLIGDLPAAHAHARDVS